MNKPSSAAEPATIFHRLNPIHDSTGQQWSVVLGMHPEQRPIVVFDAGRGPFSTFYASQIIDRATLSHGASPTFTMAPLFDNENAVVFELPEIRRLAEESRKAIDPTHGRFAVVWEKADPNCPF